MPRLFIILLTSLSLLLGQGITPVSAALPVYIAEEAAWKSKGVELAGNVTQAVLTATGADAQDIAIGTTNGTIAAENNALCGGVCVGAAMVAVAAYLTAEGDGNPLDVLGKVGAGEDTVSTAVGEAVEAGVDYGMEHHPEATVAVLGTLSEADEAVDATFSYVDDATGNLVSDNWNELPPETQNRLAGALIIGSSVIPGASAKILTKTPEADNLPQVGNGGGNKYSGGAHRDTSQPLGDGLDSHHCPAKSCYEGAPISSSDGPAIQMDPKDHKETTSYGSGKEAKDYRATQQQLLDEGRLEDAIQMDIDDIKRVEDKIGQAGKYDKADKAVQEMLDYSKTLDPNDFKSQ